jgi:hypothetical protein
MRIRDAHFISLLDKVRSESKDVLVGFFCDTIFGTHLHENILQISSKNELVRYLINEYEVKSIADHIPAIFSEYFRNNLDKTHIPHFKFIKILFHEFPTAMNLPNEVCYTNLHSYS